MKRLSLFPVFILLIFAVACNDPCDNGPCPGEPAPPVYTAFWGEAFPAIGAGAYIGDNKVILFNLEGNQYAIADEVNYTLQGPFDLDDPDGFMAGNCPFDKISAIQYFRDDRLYMFDESGTKYCRMLLTNKEYSTPSPITEWGDNTHPFDLSGVNAALHINYDVSYHFNRPGDQYSRYLLTDQSTSEAVPLILWGPDSTINLQAVGAAVYLPLAKDYAVMFAPNGQDYVIYNMSDFENGQDLFQL